MTYDDCLTQYGTDNADWCLNNSTGGAPDPSNPLEFIGGIIGGIFSNWLLIGLLVFAIVLVMIAATIIRHKSVGIVERLGKYNRNLQPGFHLIIPFFEKVIERVNMEQFSINVTSDVKTKDDQMVTLPVVAILRVIPKDASTSVYEVEDPKRAIIALISNEVKAQAATMSLDDIFTDRDTIKDAVIGSVGEIIVSYGFEVLQVVIDNPLLPEELQGAYNSIAVAQKAKEAAAAEGEVYAIKRDKIAKGNADAVDLMVGKTNLTASEVVEWMKDIDRNEAIRDASKNQGTTVVVATRNPSDSTLGLVASKG